MVVAAGKVALHHPRAVDHHDHGQGEAVPPARRWVLRVDQIECADDLGFGVGQQCKGDVLIIGKTPERRDPVVGNGGDAVAERGKALIFWFQATAWFLQ